MRADAADRIFAAPPPEALQPRTSILRIFALGLVLPFAQLHRLILAGVIPTVLIIGFILTPLGRAAIDVVRFLVEIYTHDTFYGGGGGGGTAPALVPWAAAGWASLVLLLAMLLWLCAWQRGVARGFAEPIGTWLLRSLLRLPGYTVALLVWQIAPFIITLPASFVIGWALQRNMLMAQYGVPNGLGLSAGMLTPVQWWVAGIGTLTFALLGLWMSARLSPLPAVVAGQGWRRALGRSWRASSGHGFGLSVALVGYALIGLLLALVISTLALIALAPNGFAADDTVTPVLLSLRITTIVSAVASIFVMFWDTGIAALLVRENAGLDDPLDLTTFD